MKTRPILVAILSVVLMVAMAPIALGQSLTFGGNVASNGKSYALAFADVLKPQLLRPDWKDVTYSISPCVGKDLEGPELAGAGVWIQATDHNWHAFVRLNFSGLFPMGEKPVGVFGIMGGFSFPIR